MAVQKIMQKSVFYLIFTLGQQQRLQQKLNVNGGRERSLQTTRMRIGGAALRCALTFCGAAAAAVMLLLSAFHTVLNTKRGERERRRCFRGEMSRRRETYWIPMPMKKTLQLFTRAVCSFQNKCI